MEIFYGFKIPHSLQVMLFAGFGGMIRVVQSNAKEMSVRMVIAEIMTAIFVGVIINFFLSEWEFSHTKAAPFIMLSGYCSHEILKLMHFYMVKTVEKAAASKKATGNGNGKKGDNGNG